MQHLPNASCKVVEDQTKFNVLITDPIIFDEAILEVLGSDLFVKKIQVTPRRMKHGTTFMAAVECAARKIGVNKLSCRPVSSPDGATCGKEFFSAIGFQALADGTSEKLI
jgi:hypothetical protein